MRGIGHSLAIALLLGAGALRAQDTVGGVVEGDEQGRLRLVGAVGEGGRVAPPRTLAGAGARELAAVLQRVNAPFFAVVRARAVPGRAELDVQQVVSPAGEVTLEGLLGSRWANPRTQLALRRTADGPPLLLRGDEALLARLRALVEAGQAAGQVSGLLVETSPERTLIVSRVGERLLAPADEHVLQVRVDEHLPRAVDPSGATSRITGPLAGALEEIVGPNQVVMRTWGKWIEEAPGVRRYELQAIRAQPNKRVGVYQSPQRAQDGVKREEWQDRQAPVWITEHAPLPATGLLLLRMRAGGAAGAELGWAREPDLGFHDAAGALAAARCGPAAPRESRGLCEALGEGR